MASSLAAKVGASKDIRSELAHVLLQNLDTGESQELSMNPAELRRVLNAKYNNPETLTRAPSGPSQYKNTDPLQYTIRFFADVELFPDVDMQDLEAYLDSFMYPSRTEAGIAKDPPSCLFVWPGIMAMPCKIHRISTRYTEFFMDLRPRSAQFDMILHEDGDTMRFSETERTRIIITEGIG